MLDNIWYSRKPKLISIILYPIAYIFSLIANHRKNKLIQNSYKSSIPIVVVGNISVGGTGKTPVVRKLAQELMSQGKKVAIISRGYGAKSDVYPFEVTSDTKASQCGDEPAMLYDALSQNIVIVIDPSRVDSVKYIESKYPQTDVIICDDGLQHYKLARDYEIVVVDATRMFGNQLHIPAGPLRESVDRIKDVDLVVCIGNAEEADKRFLLSYNANAHFCNVEPTVFVNLKTKEKVSISEFVGRDLFMVAGIGNPAKFFNTLKAIGMNVSGSKIFKDHHKFTAEDFLDVANAETVVMTYKDAIKCKGFACDNWWYLDIDLDIPNSALSGVYTL